LTTICDEHAALLRAIAANTNNLEVQEQYSDWLQERGSGGWLIVLEWPCWDWCKVLGWRDHEELCQKIKLEYPQEAYRIPWLEGAVKIEGSTNVRVRAKRVLTAYADGKVIS
jgi:uncharacterized protein (TIGR02996 family)